MATTNNLFPVFDVPSALAEDARKPQRKFMPGPKWDFEKGDFVFDGANRIVHGDGNDAWALWCVKTILTQRWACRAYGGDIGIEGDEAFKEPDRKAAESAFERTATEALLADPAGRTRTVRDFNFMWRDGGDGLEISCTVYSHDGQKERITASAGA